MDFKTLFKNFKCETSDKMAHIYRLLKPLLIDKLVDFLLHNRHSPAGRPIKIDFDRLFDAIYFIIESGSQTKYVSHFGISKTTYKRYVDLLSNNQIIESVYFDLINQQLEKRDPVPLITDTFSVKSMRGSNGLGRNPTDRGRKGLKVSLVCDLDRVVTGVHIDACNRHDSKCLLPTLEHMKPFHQQIDCLCDAGYVGKNLKKQCEDLGYHLIVKPKKNLNSSMTHTLTDMEKDQLHRFRNRIELLNQNVRRYKSLMIKWVQSINIYRCFLFVVLLCISCYQIISTK